MPFDARCPNDHKLRILDAQTDKKVRCPVCKVVFAASPAETEAGIPLQEEEPRHPAVDESEEKTDDESEEEGDDEEPRKGKRPRSRDKSSSGYKTVRTGLLLLILQTLVGLLCMILAVILVAAGRKSEKLEVVGSLVGFVGCVVSGTMGLVGSGMCAKAPAKARARGYVLASLVFDVLVIFMGILPLLVSLGRLGNVVAFGRNLFQAMTWVMLILFLKQLGNHLRKPSYARDAESLLYSGGLVWAGVVGVVFITRVIDLLGCMGLPLALAYGIAMLYGAIRYLIIEYLRLLIDFRALLETA